MCILLHVKYLLFSTDFNEHCIFVGRFSKNTEISNFTKICPVGAELFHANGQTYMTKLTVAFRNFVNVPCNKFRGYARDEVQEIILGFQFESCHLLHCLER
jgi:hypothetical protein